MLENYLRTFEENSYINWLIYGLPLLKRRTSVVTWLELFGMILQIWALVLGITKYSSNMLYISVHTYIYMHFFRVYEILKTLGKSTLQKSWYISSNTCGVQIIKKFNSIWVKNMFITDGARITLSKIAQNQVFVRT